METHGNGKTSIVVLATIPRPVPHFNARVRELRPIDMDTHA